MADKNQNNRVKFIISYNKQHESTTSKIIKKFLVYLPSKSIIMTLFFPNLKYHYTFI